MGGLKHSLILLILCLSKVVLKASKQQIKQNKLRYSPFSRASDNSESCSSAKIDMQYAYGLFTGE